MSKNNKPPQIFLSSSTQNEIPPLQDIGRIEWAFSFKYFKQTENFGLNGCKSSWFASFIERLSDLSKTEVDTIKTFNPSFRGGVRYHEIDWDATHIPIKRSDCTWVDRVYLENEEEFPFVQFHISKALGRVVGFWNEHSVIFYIVLLDPQHNIQPSKYSKYQVRPSHPQSCQYSALLHSIEVLKGKVHKCTDCKFASHLLTLPNNHFTTNAVIFFLEDSYWKELEGRLTKENVSLSSIIELGLLSS